MRMTAITLLLFAVGCSQPPTDPSQPSPRTPAPAAHARVHQFDLICDLTAIRRGAPPTYTGMPTPLRISIDLDGQRYSFIGGPGPDRIWGVGEHLLTLFSSEV